MLTTFLIIVCWILSICLHEFGHAVVAYWGGDTSVKEKGYLTLNPLKYIDMNMSLVLPVFFLLIGGIALPGAAVYIQKQSLRNRYWQSAVSASGPLASLLFVLLLAIPFWLNLSNSQSSIWAAIGFLIMLNIAGILLNLLPIPPLDGYGIIEPWLPRQTQIELRKFSNYGIIALFMALSYYKPFNKLLWDSTFSLCQKVGVSLELVYMGEQSFKRSSGIWVLIIIGIGFLSQRLNNPAKNWYSKGNQFFRTKKYEEAITYYDKAIKLQPNWAEAWYNRGVALFNLQKYEETITCYDKAIELQPNWAEAWYNRGVALFNLQKYKEAIASYNKAIQINPIYSNAWYNKACCYANQNNTILALKNLEKAISLEPIKTLKYAKTDPSFLSIREDENFQKLINK